MAVTNGQSGCTIAQRKIELARYERTEEGTPRKDLKRRKTNIQYSALHVERNTWQNQENAATAAETNVHRAAAAASACVSDR